MAIDSHVGSLIEIQDESLTVQTQEIYKKLNISETFLDSEVLILDPPRSGFSELKKLTQNLPHLKSIFYISCQPASAISDIAELHDFDIKMIQGFDAYPHTPHIEVLVYLSK